MAKKKKEGKILNDKNEGAVDFTAVKEGGDTYDVKNLEVQSDTKLEDDKGEGNVMTIRVFDFAANPETAKKVRDGQLPRPTAQDFFNCHKKQIEIELWKDGWTPYYEFPPRLVFTTKDESRYRIFVGALPSKGHILSHTAIPQTLTQLAHGNSPKNSNGL